MPWPPRFCADCGSPLESPGTGHASSCRTCGVVHYRNAKPCAGVLIERSGRVLLARRAVEPRLGAWDVVGGFLKPDESPQAAARREALEETGMQVVVGELLGMYVDRYGEHPGSDFTLNLYFRARCAAGDPVARSDVRELRWFAEGELPPVMAFAHQRELLSVWRRRVGGA